MQYKKEVQGELVEEHAEETAVEVVKETEELKNNLRNKKTLLAKSRV